MSEGAHHEVADLRCAPGELSFLARIGDRRQRVQFRVEDGGKTATGGDAALAACLMPAMRSGGRLTIPAPVSPKLLRNQREYQAVQRAWSLEWEFQDTALSEVEIVAPARAPEAGPAGSVAAFFSAGVDSWSVLLDNPEITDLIFVRGFDLIPKSPRHEQLTPVVETRVRMVAEKLGLTLHVVDTNLRELSDPLIQWDAYFGSACVAVALFLAPRFGRVLIAGAMDHEVDEPMGAARLIDHLWNTEALEIADAGGRYSRAERTRRIAKDPMVKSTLRVCWENRDGAYNCGRCRKCLMTMITLEAYGLRTGIETFPADLDLGDIAAIEIKQVVLLTLWEDVLDAVREEGRVDLEPAVEEAVNRAKRELGLAPSYRRRHLSGPRPLLGETPSAVPEGNPDAWLAEVLGSRSWRMTAPLRRLGGALRRRRRR